jgi:nitroreductase
MALRSEAAPAGTAPRRRYPQPDRHQDFVGTAPLNLIYVAHGERMQDVSPEERRLYASVDTGFIGQNVYLFCASEGLATVFRGSVDTKTLGATMQLGEGQFVTFAQSVGYPRA